MRSHISLLHENVLVGSVLAPNVALLSRAHDGPTPRGQQTELSSLPHDTHLSAAEQLPKGMRQGEQGQAGQQEDSRGEYQSWMSS